MHTPALSDSVLKTQLSCTHSRTHAQLSHANLAVSFAANPGPFDADSITNTMDHDLDMKVTSLDWCRRVDDSHKIVAQLRSV